MSGEIFANKYKILYSSAIGTAMSGVSAYPASGSYVDVSPYERVHILLHWGVIHDSDSPVMSLKCAEAINGTLDVISTDYDHTPAPASDDNYWATWTVEVKKLPLDHHFLALATAGTLTNGTYLDVIFLGEALDQPVTQTTTILPSAHQFAYVG